MSYDILATDVSLQNTVKGLTERNFEVIVVENGAEALAKIQQLIPKGASVMNGSSETLHEIGYIDYLKSGQHGWNNLHKAVLEEKDSEKQAILRKQALLSDYYLGSVHALVETGEYINASNTASQLPHLAFSSQNLILVVSTQKIVSTLSGAFTRLEEYVLPLEDARMKKAYGSQAGTRESKILISKYESPYVQRKVRMILVKEKLGF